MQYDLAKVREFIEQHGPVRVARQAGLAKATLLPFGRPDWNPKVNTVAAVTAVMKAGALKPRKVTKDAAA